MSDAALPSGETELASLIDRIYASVERPELWPETIGAIGRLIGGPNDFWSADSGFHPQRTPTASEAACRGQFLLSQADLRALDQYAAEFDNLIARFLRLVFLSVLWSQKDVGAREVLGARIVRRYLHSREASRSDDHVARRLIAAMWDDGLIFGLRHLQYMQLLAPHLDRAARLQMRLNLVTSARTSIRRSRSPDGRSGCRRSSGQRDLAQPASGRDRQRSAGSKLCRTKTYGARCREHTVHPRTHHSRGRSWGGWAATDPAGRFKTAAARCGPPETRRHIRLARPARRNRVRRALHQRS